MLRWRYGNHAFFAFSFRWGGCVCTHARVCVCVPPLHFSFLIFHNSDLTFRYNTTSFVTSIQRIVHWDLILVLNIYWTLLMETKHAYITSFMMASPNGSIFPVTGPLWGEPPVTGEFPSQRLWCFLWSAPEQTVEQNNRDADDLERHRAHYDVTVM